MWWGHPHPFLLLILLLFLGLLGSLEGEELCHRDCVCLDTFFDCSARGLHKLPPDLPLWVTALNMSDNRMGGSLDPGSLSRLSNLETLWLEGNGLIKLPETQIKIGIKQLFLARNGISIIEELRLIGFPTLLELDLSRNRIQDLKNGSFPKNWTLTSLSLGSNSIGRVEGGALAYLPSLTDLSLSKNRIKELGRDAFLNLKGLQRLDLSRNRLESLESLGFQDLKSLMSLNLRRNGLTNLSDAAFYGLERTQSLQLDWNGIGVVERRWLYGLDSLRTLNLSHNQIMRIEDESAQFLTQLVTLDLSYNLVEALGPKSFLGLSRLRWLDLSENKLGSLEEEVFVPLGSLDVLDLSGNELSWPIEDMSGPFQGLIQVTTINLAGNRIRTLHPEAFLGLHSLRFLDLSRNPLGWIPEASLSLIPNAGLGLLEVTTLLCDCNSGWFQRRLSSGSGGGGGSGSRLRGVGGGGVRGGGGGRRAYKAFPVCGHPPALAGRPFLEVSEESLKCSNESVLPVFLEEPRTQTFLMEGNGTLRCEVSGSGSSPLTLVWRRSHAELPKHLESNVGKRERVRHDGRIELLSTLEFTNVSWSDAGSYQCVAGNSVGVVYSAKANLTVHVFPTFVKRPSNVTVRLGSNAKLECGARGFPTPEIAFQKDGGEDFPAALERRFHVMPNDDSFFIMEVKLADMGVYSCSARNSAGSIRAYASVTVYETPSLREVMEDETAVLGSNALLQCLSMGSPRPSVTWTKDGEVIVEGKGGGRFHFSEEGALLLIKDVEEEDAGRYECLLSNAVGTARGFATLTVLRENGSKVSPLDESAMNIMFIIIAVFCVVGTSAAWVVVIYRTRKRAKLSRSGGGGVSSAPSSPPPLRGTGGGGFSSLDDEDGPGGLAPLLTTTQISSGLKGYGGGGTEVDSQVSSGKDSGTGEDGPPDPLTLFEDSTTTPRRNKDLESYCFSTFGSTSSNGRTPSSLPPIKSATLRWSQGQQGQSRGSMREEDGTDVISVSFAPGQEFQSIPRRIPIPIPPPVNNKVKVKVPDPPVSISTPV